MPKSKKGSKHDELAEWYVRLKAVANRAGRALHDDLGPLLPAAGLHLQLMRMDHPEMAGEIDRIAGILERAYERIRSVSQELSPSPVLRTGLKYALERLVERTGEEHPGIAIKLVYKIAKELPVAPACALYDAAAAAVLAAAKARGATRIGIRASGTRQISIRIADNGRPRGRAQALAAARRAAQAEGFLVTIATKRGTIVSVRYALRRSAGG